ETIDKSAVIASKDVALTWEPDNTYVKDQFATVILGQDIEYIDNEAKTSYVAAFSITDFIASAYVTDPSISNINLVLTTATQMVGQEKSPLEFTMKYFEAEDFSATVKEASAKAIKTIFVIILPIGLLVSGAVVFVKRRLR
ncbi:MAG: hypothetical protein J6Q74_01635, partial [Clostridia bacterium]|nr:hypothetical protein [Clostridia bacterium]